MIQHDALSRLACFLSQYAQDKDGGVIPPEPAYVKSAIRLLIDEEVMTAEEIRREALEEFGVIVPAELLPARSYAK